MSRYKADWGRVVWSHDVLTTDTTIVTVIPGLLHTHHGHCESFWDPVLLEDYVGDLYQVAQAQATAAEAKPKAAP
eukprot:2774930-Heterocapsa_arctica.AAC.1